MGRDRSKWCATCGKPRGPLEQRRGSFGADELPAVPRAEAAGSPGPWQSYNDLICHVGIYRNGGCDESTHLCDDCLRVGLRALKLRIDGLLAATEPDAGKDAELARLTAEVARLQYVGRECAAWRGAHVPEYAANYGNYLRACGLLWGYFNSPEPLFRERFGEVADPWAEIRRLMKE